VGHSSPAYAFDLGRRHKTVSLSTHACTARKAMH